MKALILSAAVALLTTGCISSGTSFYGGPSDVRQTQIPRLWAWAGVPVTVVDERKPPANYVAPTDGSSNTWNAYSKEVVEQTRRIMLEAVGPATKEQAENLLVTIVDYRVEWQRPQWVGISTITVQARRLDVVDQEWTGQARLVRTNWMGMATAATALRDAYEEAMVDLLKQMAAAKPQKGTRL